MTPAAEAEYAATSRRCAELDSRYRSTARRRGTPDPDSDLSPPIWTVLFTESGRYNWLLQYLPGAEGVTLSWVGTGRCLISMDFTDEDFSVLQDKIAAAATAMQRDGWWQTTTDVPDKERLMRKQLVVKRWGFYSGAIVRSHAAPTHQKTPSLHSHIVVE